MDNVAQIRANGGYVHANFTGNSGAVLGHYVNEDRAAEVIGKIADAIVTGKTFFNMPKE